MRSQETRAGGRYLARERGADAERESREPAPSEDPEIRPATAPLAEFLPGNDAIALRIWAESLEKYGRPEVERHPATDAGSSEAEAGETEQA